MLTQTLNKGIPMFTLRRCAPNLLHARTYATKPPLIPPSLETQPPVGKQTSKISTLVSAAEPLNKSRVKIPSFDSHFISSIPGDDQIDFVQLGREMKAILNRAISDLNVEEKRCKELIEVINVHDDWMFSPAFHDLRIHHPNLVPQALNDYVFRKNLEAGKGCQIL